MLVTIYFRRYRRFTDETPIECIESTYAQGYSWVRVLTFIPFYGVLKISGDTGAVFVDHYSNEGD